MFKCGADGGWAYEVRVESDGDHDRGLRGAAFLHATIDMGESRGDMSHIRNSEVRVRATIVLKPKTARGRVARLVG